KVLTKYKSLLETAPSDARFNEAALFISKEHLLLVPTPDLLVQYSGCGPAVVEVKCPWTIRDGSLNDLNNNPKGPVVEIDKAPLQKESHCYFQMQAQTLNYNVLCADFFFWRGGGGGSGKEKKNTVERVARNEVFTSSKV
ncbi:unnamed protein product, partial [Ixodes persulcatus]